VVNAVTPLLEKPPYPMLARVGTLVQLSSAVANNYVIEPKLDGIRCLAMIDVVGGGRTVRLFNRNLVDITARFPDVTAQLHEHTYGDGITLDGEIYVVGERGEPDFQLVQTRTNRVRNVDAMAEKYPAKYAAFDCLRAHRRDIMRWSLDLRRDALDNVANRLAVPTYTQDEARDRYERRVGEGLMLKHWSSKYDAGSRSPSWLKVKWLREAEVRIGGVTFGIGKREGTFGGLLLGVPLPEDREGKGRLKYVGTVGTGFTDSVLSLLYTHLTQLKTADCPFEAHSSDWDLNFFVRPVVRARVSFAEYTRDGIMRFPRWSGLLP
jgi:bifunctional non-homologous end joining protein LigD